MKAIKFILNLFLGLAIISLASFATAKERELRDTITIAADYWCPYNCTPDDEKPGFLVELAKRALYIYGIDVEYRLMPWHEALSKAESGEIDGVFGISSVEGKNLVQSRTPLEYSWMHSFTRRDTEWKYDGINSLRSMKLGVIMDYMLDNAVSSYVTMNFPMHPEWFTIEDGELAVIESIANLIDGDSDVFIEDIRVVEYYTRENGLAPYIRNSGQINKDRLPIYIALSSQLPHAKRYIRFLEEGVASLKATGEYDDLMDKYNIEKSHSSEPSH